MLLKHVVKCEDCSSSEDLGSHSAIKDVVENENKIF